jgi:hypothetical protein
VAYLDATACPNQDREPVRFAVLIETVQTVMVRTVKVQTDSVQSVTARIDLVLNVGIRIADSPNAMDVRKFPDAMVVPAARSVVLVARSVAVEANCFAEGANCEAPHFAAEDHYAAEQTLEAVRFVAVELHTTETVSQRAARALKARRVHDHVTASRQDPN